MSGIYIHIPFCKQACNYCDFHFSTNLKLKDELVDAIVLELELRKNYLSEKKLSSIYFGGGTPSLLGKKDLEKILEKISSYFQLSKNVEVTFEVNTDDVTEMKLKDWKQVGINRLSIGLQSFDDEELKWFNRIHSSSQGINSVKMAQDKGFRNISIDLIYGSKFQNENKWAKTLEQAVSLNVQHISAYNLTIENKTDLGIKNRKGIEPSVNDEMSSRYFEVMVEYLEKQEFEHYEISNFSKDSFMAVHNSNYWHQKNYLGLGPSAHSYNGNSRQWNLKSNSGYISAIKSNGVFFDKEELSTNNKYNEYVMTRLRTKWGCDIREIEKCYGKMYSEYFRNRVEVRRCFL